MEGLILIFRFLYLDQGIQEYLWKTVFKEFEVIWIYAILDKILETYSRNLVKYDFLLFYSWFFAVFQHNYQNIPFGWPAEYSPSIASIWGIFLRFPNFLKGNCAKTWERLLIFCPRLWPLGTWDSSLVPKSLLWICLVKFSKHSSSLSLSKTSEY